MAGESAVEDDDETLLISIALYQDKAALSALITRYGAKLKGYLTKHYGNTLRAPEVDEAANRTFFNVWRFADRFQPSKGHFRGWLVRIAQNVAVSLIRAEDRHQAKQLEYEPAYDPADACEDDAPECGTRDRSRVEMLRDIIENELSPLEKAIALADIAAGEPANAERLARLHRTSKNVIYSTRSQMKVKIRKLILAREAKAASPRGKK